jgi:hypothetical protein
VGILAGMQEANAPRLSAPVARLMFRLVRNRDPSCARVSWTMKRLWCPGVVPSLNPEPAVSKASETTAMQVGALPTSLSSEASSSHTAEVTDVPPLFFQIAYCTSESCSLALS